MDVAMSHNVVMMLQNETAGAGAYVAPLRARHLDQCQDLVAQVGPAFAVDSDEGTVRSLDVAQE
jgi:hypothetical protein|eukprot:SAG25_NODE_1636_length_2642_cov_19.232397_1_plen_64_part_00